ncbi:MAG: hypothetical protein D6805_06295 [Planctomycetota bacterium]|nr:MAG: hypothetical protein D6805_06295 [Planctomycetota bacterium]
MKGCFSVLIFLIAIAAAVFLSNDYGKKLTFLKGELYYTDPVKEEEAKKVGKILQEEGYFNNKRRVSVQLKKEKKQYQLRFVVTPEAIQEKKYHLSFAYIGGKIAQKALQQAPLVVHLCDEKLKTKQTVQPFYTKQFSNTEIAYYPSTPLKTVDKIGAVFQNIWNGSIFLEEKNNQITVWPRFVSKEKALKAKPIAQAIAHKLQTLFPPKKVQVILTDRYLEEKFLKIQPLPPTPQSEK